MNEKINRIASAFGPQKAFIPFITGGDPDIETTEKLITAMADAGADMVEIGIPFSDPIAEGPVIQRADERALAGGCTVDKLFAMVKRLRERVRIPLLFMTYVNPVFVYGRARFARQCADCGIDGVIVPDLPYEERGELLDGFRAAGLSLISMIAPTSGARAAEIARNSEGFLYCVSSLGVTGVRTSIRSDIAGLIAQVKKISGIPCAVGFGISTPEQAREMAAFSDGVIIGSAIVQLVEAYGRESVEPARRFTAGIKEALNVPL